MASVSVDLGFGERAIISRRSVSGAPTAMHVRDAEEFLRRWPRTRSVDEARRYLQQLALHAGYNPPGVKGSDTIAVFRAAVRSGKVTVVIERAATRPGGGSSAAQSTARPDTAVGPSRQSFAEMAPVASGESVLGDGASPTRVHSWMQSYDDVSADDLISYIESVVGKTPAQVAGTEGNTSLGTALSAPLADSGPFALTSGSTTDDLTTVAARGVSEADEAGCFEQYERDLEMCQAVAAPMGGARGLALCKQQAFDNYQQCRGY